MVAAVLFALWLVDHRSLCRHIRELETALKALDIKLIGKATKLGTELDALKRELDGRLNALESSPFAERKKKDEQLLRDMILQNPRGAVFAAM